MNQLIYQLDGVALSDYNFLPNPSVGGLWFTFNFSTNDRIFFLILFFLKTKYDILKWYVLYFWQVFMDCVIFS